MINRKRIASILTASFVGAVMFTAPAAALPGGNAGDPAQSIPDLFLCYPQDATGALDLNGTCNSKNTLKLDANGDPAVGMYWENGQLSEGAPHPTSTVFFDNSFYFGAFWITCNSRLTPSGMYSGNCYFNKQTQKNFQP